VAAYRADADHQEVSKDSLGRASRILQALAAEAVRRGHTVKTPEASAERYAGARVRSLPKGQLRIVIGGYTYRLRIREQSGKGGQLLPYGRQRDRLPYWQQTRQTTFLPTGQLRITVEEGYSRDGRQAEFRDSKRASLEERLPEVLRELEIRAAEDPWHRQEEERKAQEKQRRWERAMDHARRDFREARRAEVLRGQLADWQLGNDLDEYLAAMQASILTLTSVKEQNTATAWLAWAKEYRQSINPLAKPLAMPPVPKPKPDELKPYLRGWNRTAREPEDLNGPCAARGSAGCWNEWAERNTMRFFLDDELLSGSYDVATLLRPQRAIRCVDDRAAARVVSVMTYLCQVWGGNAHPIVPITDLTVPEPYLRCMYSEQYDIVDRRFLVPGRHPHPNSRYPGRRNRPVGNPRTRRGGRSPGLSLLPPGQRWLCPTSIRWPSGSRR
jgi:hypothetical protein